MLYWKAEVFDYTRDGVPCFQRLIGRGNEDSFLMFLQGLGATPEKQGLWVYDCEKHAVEVTLIPPSEFMEHRSEGLRFSNMVAQLSEDASNHALLDILVERELVAEIFDTVYDNRVLFEDCKVLNFA
jgi:hypothetical protein